MAAARYNFTFTAFVQLLMARPTRNRSLFSLIFGDNFSLLQVMMHQLRHYERNAGRVTSDGLFMICLLVSFL